MRERSKPRSPVGVCGQRTPLPAPSGGLGCVDNVHPYLRVVAVTVGVCLVCGQRTPLPPPRGGLGCVDNVHPYLHILAVFGVCGQRTPLPPHSGGVRPSVRRPSPRMFRKKIKHFVFVFFGFLKFNAKVFVTFLHETPSVFVCFTIAIHQNDRIDLVCLIEYSVTYFGLSLIHI